MVKYKHYTSWDLLSQLQGGSWNARTKGVTKIKKESTVYANKSHTSIVKSMKSFVHDQKLMGWTPVVSNAVPSLSKSDYNIKPSG